MQSNRHNADNTYGEKDARLISIQHNAQLTKQAGNNVEVERALLQTRRQQSSDLKQAIS